MAIAKEARNFGANKPLDAWYFSALLGVRYINLMTFQKI